MHFGFFSSLLGVPGGADAGARSGMSAPPMGMMAIIRNNENNNKIEMIKNDKIEMIIKMK